MTAGDKLALFDTHAHVTDPKFADDLTEVESRWEQAGVVGVVCAGDTLASSRLVINLARQRSDIYAAVGIHPENVESYTADTIDRLRELARYSIRPIRGRCQEFDSGQWQLALRDYCCEHDPDQRRHVGPDSCAEHEPDQQQTARVVAIGEIGLDYYWDTSQAELQRQVFREQLELARELQLPVLVHDREAHQDTMTILKEFTDLTGVVLHCFSGDRQMLDQCLELGFYLGVGGTLTYPKNGALQELIRDVPLKRLLLETDCPYLAPQAWRGRRNEPAYLTAVAAVLAEVLGVTLEAVARSTTDNARRFFGLDQISS